MTCITRPNITNTIIILLIIVVFFVVVSLSSAVKHKTLANISRDDKAEDLAHDDGLLLSYRALHLAHLIYSISYMRQTCAHCWWSAVSVCTFVVNAQWLSNRWDHVHFCYGRDRAVCTLAQNGLGLAPSCVCLATYIMVIFTYNYMYLWLLVCVSSCSYLLTATGCRRCDEHHHQYSANLSNHDLYAIV